MRAQGGGEGKGQHSPETRVCSSEAFRSLENGGDQPEATEVVLTGELEKVPPAYRTGYSFTLSQKD